MPVGLVETGDGGDAGVDDGGDRLLVYPVDKGSGATTSLVEADGLVEVEPDTESLAAGEVVTVELFSPAVRPPALLAVGESDPALSRLLDRIDRPRFLDLGSREGLRRLRERLPDVAVVAGSIERDVDAEPLGGWTREWGLVVPAGNPAAVADLADLADADLRFRNRGRESGLRADLDDRLADLAETRDVARAELERAIDGYGRTAKGVESPARAVAEGRADVGLGLRATADALGLDFVPLGEQPVRLLANPDRTAKPAVATVAEVLEDLDEVLGDLPGYRA